jgi:hypothetical protein
VAVVVFVAQYVYTRIRGIVAVTWGIAVKATVAGTPWRVRTIQIAISRHAAGTVPGVCIAYKPRVTQIVLLSMLARVVDALIAGTSNIIVAIEIAFNVVVEPTAVGIYNSAASSKPDYPQVTKVFHVRNGLST